MAFAILLAAAFLRCPSILIHGRVWAEENAVFLQFSERHTFAQVLMVQHFGYFSIWDNFLGAVAAHWIPLSLVAIAFSWSAVLILLLTGYIVFQAEFLSTRSAKLIAVAALVLTAPSLETWLNVLNSEFYFGLCSAIILVSDASRIRLQRFACLLVAVLCGPVTTLLAPLFFVRAVFGRTRPQIVQAAIVCLGGLAQIGVALSSAMAHRKVQPNPLPLGAILFVKDVLVLFFTRSIANRSYAHLEPHLPPGHALLVAFWVATLAVFCALGWVFRRQGASLRLFGIALWLAMLQFTLGRGAGVPMLNPIFGERYAFVPNFLLELALVIVAVQASAGIRREWARVLLALAFVSGLYDFVALPVRMPQYWKGEPWRQQVLRQQRDPAVVLHGFPTDWSLPDDEIPPP